jgi:hypothetical protein
VPLVAEPLELAVLVDASRDAGVATDPRASGGDDDLALASRAHGNLIARVQAGGAHRLDWNRDLVLGGHLWHRLYFIKWIVKAECLLRGWMARENTTIMAVLCLIIGAKLIATRSVR